MINILTEKDIFITPNTNVARESISKWVKNLSDGVNSIDDEMMKFVGANKTDTSSTSDGNPTTTASETHNYDSDDSPYFIRSYIGTVNQSFSELGIDYNIDIS